jgi:hypothetical protein
MTTKPYLEAQDEAAAIDFLEANGCTDGLPIIAPTAARVDRMVLAGGLDGDLALGRVPPRNAHATVEAVAANAVMAGCAPDHFPVVLAAVQASLDPVFDLNDVQSTTNCVSPVIIVNGPARSSCGPIVSGHGALGTGHRANLGIGRAFRLVLFNLGGGRPGEGDMALFGHGGKFAACFAEAEEQSPFEPLHVSRGWHVNDSVVTVAGVEPPQQVIHMPFDDARRSAECLLALLGGAIADPGCISTYSGTGYVVVVLNPDHAWLLHRAGYRRETIQQALADHARSRVGRLRELNPRLLEMTEETTGRRNDDVMAAACLPERVLVVVAGGEGNYSFVMPSWGSGLHNTTPVSKTIEINQACEIPQYSVDERAPMSVDFASSAHRDRVSARS